VAANERRWSEGVKCDEKERQRRGCKRSDVFNDSRKRLRGRG